MRNPSTSDTYVVNIPSLVEDVNALGRVEKAEEVRICVKLDVETTSDIDASGERCGAGLASSDRGATLERQVDASMCVSGQRNFGRGNACEGIDAESNLLHDLNISEGWYAVGDIPWESSERSLCQKQCQTGWR